jgi:DNA-binding PadR family transcriptional regulator
MYPDTHLPPPLPNSEFYVLLALSRSELHGYALNGAITNDSLGSIKLNSGSLYRVLGNLLTDGFIQQSAMSPAGKSGRERMHYRLTTEGKLRLEEEASRLRHAVQIADAAGVFDNEVPIEIRRLMAESEAG